ncbi:MAG: DUF3307 domain-containing protein [Candidatus Theseobacter exili]|nr:DUF3307 domain-containing protein [Candidatus Theseobacter exili]
MFLFLRFLLAHFIADFPLQTDFVYRSKRMNKWGGLLHGTILALCMAALSFPFWDYFQLWAFIAFVCGTHIILDWKKNSIKDESKVFKSLMLFIFDQIFHITIISLVFLTPLTSITPLPSSNSPALFSIYFDNVIISQAIVFVVVVFGGMLAIYFCEQKIFPIKPRKQLLQSPEKTYGIVERSLFFIILCKGGLALLLIPALVVLRIFYISRELKKFKLKRFKPSFLATIYGLIITLSGWIFLKAFIKLAIVN